ncbi:MAG: hypothetical protein GX946_09760 [Oligosphaeraceae bacterium]|nr:hypothetical protein [Oligosphaeraceae bacterium]
MHNQLNPEMPPAFDPELVLAEYMRRKTIESMAGPLLSLIVHVLLVGCIIIFYDPEPPAVQSSIELEMKELEVKELDQKELEKLEELEELAQEAVPTVERPMIVTDSATDAIGDVAAAVGDFSDQIASTDDSMNFSDVLDIRANDSPLQLSALYGGRTDAGRASSIRKFGGSVATERAVVKALEWLKSTQNADGSWAPGSQPAMTGLCLLAYLAHGETPTSEEYGATVQRAMQYLVRHVERLPNTVDSKQRVEPYTNGIVAYALSEAYGLTKLPNLKPAMEKSLGLLIEGQQKNGGYDYGYARAQRWDLSVAGWQFQAMKAGYVAGANVKGLEKGIELGISFIKDVAYNKDNARRPMGYSSPGGGSWGMQGVGALCLQLFGEGNAREVRHVSKVIADEHVPAIVWTDPKLLIAGAHSNPLYHWYYETQVMFHAGQNSWKKWNEKMSNLLISNQKHDGYWECPPGLRPDPATGKVGNPGVYDRWYSTALSCLTLQVYYRYLPTYKMPKAIAKEEKTVLDRLDEELGLSL